MRDPFRAHYISSCLMSRLTNFGVRGDEMKPFVITILCVAGVLSGSVVEDHHVAQPYRFGYESQDEWGNAQSRHEEDLGDGIKRGSFGYRDAHGMFRLVNYIADHGGFRAWVKTNEPGTADSTPAATRIEKAEDAVRVAPTFSAVKAAATPLATPLASPLATPLAAAAATATATVSDYVSASLSDAETVAGPVAGHVSGPSSAFVSAEVAAPARILALSKPQAPSSVLHSAFGHKLIRSLPLAYAASQADQARVHPIAVRKVVGPSAAAFVSVPAAASSKVHAAPQPADTLSASPVVTVGLHVASSEAIAVAPALAASAKKPYEKFAETFRRRRPIKTIGEKEVYVPPTILSVGGVPVYKDK